MAEIIGPAGSRAWRELLTVTFGVIAAVPVGRYR